ncbi:hypothetical protein BCR34DRAFT_331997 [Clohesyomyces aquaticus]|uniref:Uncharacterized protein n=1 Tax=Clohesyomyces aquaticus TaxID=1231657 RepID=A0A1Y1ZLZ4_9PLEO|nr:hypothetical protein BCR34DRAFT_331997 [Clohesyomyces aquaticus]
MLLYRSSYLMRAMATKPAWRDSDAQSWCSPAGQGAIPAASFTSSLRRISCRFSARGPLTVEKYHATMRHSTSFADQNDQRAAISFEPRLDLQDFSAFQMMDLQGMENSGEQPLDPSCPLTRLASSIQVRRSRVGLCLLRKHKQSRALSEKNSLHSRFSPPGHWLDSTQTFSASPANL